MAQQSADDQVIVDRRTASALKVDSLWQPDWIDGLPDRWVRCPMACVGYWGSGGTPRVGHPDYYGGEIPWLTIADLHDDVVLHAATHITRDGLENSSAKMVPIDAVFVAMYGSIGKAGIAGIECCTNQAIAHCIPNPQVVTTRYLFRLVLALRRDLIEQGKGGAQQNISQTVIKHLKVAIPPLPEQHRIIARVDELMGLLDRLEAAGNTREEARTASRNAALAALWEADNPQEVDTAWQRIADRIDDLLAEPADVDRLRQTVLQLAVRGRLVPQDPRDETATVLLESIAAEKTLRIEDEKRRGPEATGPAFEEGVPFEVPDGWRWTTLGQLSLDGPSNGWSPKAVEHDTGLRTLKLSATTKGVFDGTKYKYVEARLDTNSPLWLMPGDLLIQRSNTPEYVGMAAVYRGAERAFIYPDLMMRCRLSSKVSIEFIHAALIAPFNRRWFAQRASGTSQSMVKINQATVRATAIPLPPLAEQQRIVACVDKLMGLLDRLEQQLIATQATHSAFAAAVVHHLDA